MKSKIAAIIIALIFCTQASAGIKTAPTAAPSSETAAIEAKYRALNDLTSTFVQTTDIALVGRTVTKHGIFMYKKGGKLRIEYEGKDAKHYVSDGAILWTYVPGDESSLLTFEVNDKTVPKEALSFMSGFGKLTKEFEVSQSDAFTEKSEGSAALHLVPKAKSQQYEWLDALFGPDHMLSDLIVKNTSGNTSRYKFSNIKTNTGLPDSKFTLSSGKAFPDTLPE